MAKSPRSKKKPKGPQEPPMCACLLLCDDVLVSQGRGKHTLTGIIGIIAASELPATIGGFVAYVRFTNVYGAQKLTMSLVFAKTETEIFTLEIETAGKSDPLGVYTFVVPIRPFRVEEAGRYVLSAKSDGVPVAQTPILVVGPMLGDEP